MRWWPILVLMIPFSSYGQEPVEVSKDLFITQISEHCYVHTSITHSPEWGKFGSNGLLVADAGEGILLDTPMDDSTTFRLLSYINDSMGIKLVGFIPNHFHNDCVGGIRTIREAGIPVTSYYLTDSIMRYKDSIGTNHQFVSSKLLYAGYIEIISGYFGAGHTEDNIAVWVEEDRVLFMGCMLKSKNSETLGNIADANLEKWPSTLKRIKQEYPEAVILVPGHGNWGDASMIDHTLHLLKQNRN